MLTEGLYPFLGHQHPLYRARYKILNGAGAIFVGLSLGEGSHSRDRTVLMVQRNSDLPATGVDLFPSDISMLIEALQREMIRILEARDAG